MIGAAMRPFTVSSEIPAPPAEVFEYLADLANRPSFTDEFQRDFRLARIGSHGLGAAARYRIGGPLRWRGAEFEISELNPPHLIVERGRAGRVGRIAVTTEYRLEETGAGWTRVDVTVSSEPGRRLDRVREAFGGSIWLRRQIARSLDRLASLFSSSAARGEHERVTVAGLSMTSDPLAYVAAQGTERPT